MTYACSSTQNAAGCCWRGRVRGVLPSSTCGTALQWNMHVFVCHCRPQRICTCYHRAVHCVCCAPARHRIAVSSARVTALECGWVGQFHAMLTTKRATDESTTPVAPTMLGVSNAGGPHGCRACDQSEDLQSAGMYHCNHVCRATAARILHQSAAGLQRRGACACTTRDTEGAASSMHGSSKSVSFLSKHAPTTPPRGATVGVAAQQCVAGVGMPSGGSRTLMARSDCLSNANTPGRTV